MIRFCALTLALLFAAAPAFAAECFSSSKIYRIHPIHGGNRDTRDSWAVQGASFAECVHHAEAAEKSLHAKYPEGIFQLSLTSTIGCHSPC